MPPQRNSPCNQGLTLPSSGPVPAGFAVLHGPLKSNVSPLAHSMMKSVVHALASGSAASKRSRSLSLHRRHSGVSSARHGALRELQLSSPATLRAPASKVGNWVSLSERSGIHRRSPQGSEQYTSAQAPLADAQSKWRSSRSLVLFIERANPSFKRTCLRQSA